MTYNYIMTTEAKATAAESRPALRWAVGWIVPADTQDDRTEKKHICAIFENPISAETFIDCMGADVKERFFITRIDTKEG